MSQISLNTIVTPIATIINSKISQAYYVSVLMALGAKY